MIHTALSRIAIIRAILILTFLAPQQSQAQETIADYAPAHQAAIKAFLRRHPTISFMPESWFGAENLTLARMETGTGLKPYYATEDFNKNGLQDFAVLLRKAVTRQKAILLIFEQAADSTYKVVFSEPIWDRTDLYIYATPEHAFSGLRCRVLHKKDGEVCYRWAGNEYRSGCCGYGCDQEYIDYNKPEY